METNAPKATRNETAGGEPPAVGRSDAPIYQVTLWPHRSLGRRGYGLVMGGTAAMLSLPMIPLAGSRAALGLLPFVVAALAALGWFLRRNARDLSLHEELRLWPDLVAVERHEPDGRVRRWQANPHWVRLTLHPHGRPENYLTLRGNGREIELGAFLSPEERVELADQLETAFARARGATG
ncbi:DUF2244 domain-containing protein [Albimonas sp. CAU 1670]|uniref:DUF2244 domain-containing protein n=1 Tax=Albimonas sp. CAU 1670 TaxID=3032599 RepID=UPI0023DB5584|nr:DUF2244 domain-containing protein [Albimonas sp. CAU 1670]MDF2234553.1 DUF2244 domain-containing protein [Albimonas sp. CAU 1670]